MTLEEAKKEIEGRLKLKLAYWKQNPEYFEALQIAVNCIDEKIERDVKSKTRDSACGLFKVYRYMQDDIGCEYHDGFFFSKIYAVDNGKVLVYDDGSYSAVEEEDFLVGFEWIDPTETYYDSCGKRHHCIIEPVKECAEE